MKINAGLTLRAADEVINNAGAKDPRSRRRKEVK